MKKRVPMRKTRITYHQDMDNNIACNLCYISQRVISNSVIVLVVTP